MDSYTNLTDTFGVLKPFKKTLIIKGVSIEVFNRYIWSIETFLMASLLVKSNSLNLTDTFGVLKPF